MHGGEGRAEQRQPAAIAPPPAAPNQAPSMGGSTCAAGRPTGGQRALHPAKALRSVRDDGCRQGAGGNNQCAGLQARHYALRCQRRIGSESISTARPLRTFCDGGRRILRQRRLGSGAAPVQQHACTPGATTTCQRLSGQRPARQRNECSRHSSPQLSSTAPQQHQPTRAARVGQVAHHRHAVDGLGPPCMKVAAPSEGRETAVSGGRRAVPAAAGSGSARSHPAPLAAPAAQRTRAGDGRHVLPLGLEPLVGL